MKIIETTSSQSVGIDLSRYRRHVDHLDLPDDRKDDLLRAVWQITGSEVDRAFGDDSAQLCRKDGDENQLTREDRLLPVVSSEDHHNPEETLTTAFGTRARKGRRKETR